MPEAEPVLLSDIAGGIWKGHSMPILTGTWRKNRQIRRSMEGTRSLM
jgi:hypothetical protein